MDAGGGGIRRIGGRRNAPRSCCGVWESDPGGGADRIPASDQARRGRVFCGLDCSSDNQMGNGGGRELRVGDLTTEFGLAYLWGASGGRRGSAAVAPVIRAR